MKKEIIFISVLIFIAAAIGSVNADVATECKVISVEDGFYDATAGGIPNNNPFLYLKTDKGEFVYFPFEHASEPLFDENEMLRSFKATALSAMSIGKRITVYYFRNPTDGCWSLPDHSAPCNRILRIVLTSAAE
jgi:hypothetical protein